MLFVVKKGLSRMRGCKIKVCTLSKIGVFYIGTFNFKRSINNKTITNLSEKWLKMNFFENDL